MSKNENYVALLEINLMIDQKDKFSLINEMYRINKGIDFIQKSDDVKTIKKALNKILRINHKIMSTIDVKGNGKEVLPGFIMEDQI